MTTFKRLSDVEREVLLQLLTIRSVKAFLKREKGEKTLFVELGSNPEVMTTSGERRQHFETASPGWLKSRLERFQQPEVEEVEVANPQHPLEVLYGNVCLILVVEGKKYILGIYRDIPPEGWTIPGGCSSSLDDIFNPRLVAARECREEVLISDSHDTFYTLGDTCQECLTNIERWGLKPNKIVKLWPRELYFNTGVAQNLVITQARGIERRERIRNIAVSLDTETATAGINLFWQVELPVRLAELRLFDCETGKDKSLLDRRVRLAPGEIVEFKSGQVVSAGWIVESIAAAAAAAAR